ncbi:hypothetical protein [Saccharopolyspora pogona]|uniref:hypothetical protein n=1 Tax=Saccharopolyspora pogona TaxID=333966 RepID=UPI0016846226|nr:hypothetical protein [Saccharopolyspora pogona]
MDAPTEQVKRDIEQNIRAGAALLAERAKKLGDGQLPNTIGGGYPAIAELRGSPQASGAQDFADSVYDVLGQGRARTTSTGQRVKPLQYKVPAGQVYAAGENASTRRIIACFLAMAPNQSVIKRHLTEDMTNDATHRTQEAMTAQNARDLTCRKAATLAAIRPSRDILAG